MNYIEVEGSIFNIDEKYYMAHCISCDARMGAGIAKEFVSIFPELEILRDRLNYNKIGDCVRVGRVFNLITKDRYYNKPTYQSLDVCLKEMRRQLYAHQIKYLAMPKIGCGLDRLSWEVVREMVKDVFKEMDIEIKVCYL